MPSLIDSIDPYGEFDKNLYFIVCYDKIPSSLCLKTPMEETKAQMEAVLKTLDVESYSLEVIFKNWTTEDAKNADFTQDYPYQYFLKSSSKELLVWIALERNELTVDFYYDNADAAIEKWVVATNHTLRTTFGLDRKSVFKVLSRDRKSFFTEDVRTSDFQCAVDTMYNDDFIQVHEAIEASLAVEKAGLILLHGVPGTGKTSYIKSLITKHTERSFIFIQNEFVNELLHPDFISFLLKNQNAILIIEDAEKVLISREQKNENSVVSTILQLTDGLFSDYLNIKIICTFNTSMNKIDSALLRKG
ncbi:MAG: AAA family ATPase, partial [Bacteroidota bacterium]